MSPSSDGYLPIEIASISSNSILDFDLYNESGGCYQLFRRHSVALDQEDLDTLVERGTTTLFVPESQSGSLCDHQMKQLPELLQDDSVSVERKVAVLTEISTNLYERFLVAPVPPGTVKRAVNQCENHVGLALQGESAQQSMLHKNSETFSPSAHAVSVCNLSILLGLEFGMTDPEYLHAVGIGGLLHEVGKTMIDSRYYARAQSTHCIANARLRNYPQIGAKMLGEEPVVPEDTLRSVLEHQERLDGSGFPKSLRGPEISTGARIVGICDAFDEAISLGQGTPSAFKVLMKMKDSATKYDTRLFQSFVRLLGSDVARSCRGN